MPKPKWYVHYIFRKRMLNIGFQTKEGALKALERLSPMRKRRAYVATRDWLIEEDLLEPRFPKRRPNGGATTPLPSREKAKPDVKKDKDKDDIFRYRDYFAT